MKEEEEERGEDQKNEQERERAHTTYKAFLQRARKTSTNCIYVKVEDRAGLQCACL